MDWWFIFHCRASGALVFEKRGKKWVINIIVDKIDRIVISYKDRLSRVGFGLFKHLFNKYGCEIIVISEIGSEKLDNQEIFEEIISLLHCYSMKFYSSKKQ